MYPWYYVWSPKYRIFHEILQFAVKDISGVALNPIGVPQSIFPAKVDLSGGHFLTGIGIKIYCLVKSLLSNPNQYIVFSDVDLIVLDKELAKKLQSYEVNDITAMREKKDKDEYNIGLMLVKSTPTVIAFFEKILQRIHKECKLDQDVFNEEIKSFEGTHGFFDVKDFIQSNMIRKDIWDMGNYSVIQCLSSEHSSMKVIMLGKLMTIVFFYDIRHLIHMVDRDTITQLQEDIKSISPTHYLCSLKLDEIYAPPSTTEELPKNA